MARSTPLTTYLFGEFALRLETAFKEALPSFRMLAESARGRTWQWAGWQSLHLFVCVDWWTNGYGFTVDLAWSRSGALPEKGAVPCNAALDALAHRFSMSDLWLQGQPDRGWSFLPPEMGSPPRLGPALFKWRRQAVERELPIVYAGLLNADTVVKDAADKLLEYGVPFLRRVAEEHGVGAVAIGQVFPLVARAPRPRSAGTDKLVAESPLALGAIADCAAGAIPREVWAATLARSSQLRQELRLRSAYFHRAMPSFWCRDMKFTATEIMVNLLLSALLVNYVLSLSRDEPRIRAKVAFGLLFIFGLVAILSGVYVPTVRLERRLRRLSKHSCTDEQFVLELKQLRPEATTGQEVALAVRRAYALALDLPVDVVLVDNVRPSFYVYDWPPMLHEFAIYLSGLLPSKPDPFILGNLLARKKRRAGILDFIEATEAAMQDIDRVEPRGKAGK